MATKKPRKAMKAMQKKAGKVCMGIENVDCACMYDEAFTPLGVRDCPIARGIDVPSSSDSTASEYFEDIDYDKVFTLEKDDTVNIWAFDDQGNTMVMPAVPIGPAAQCILEPESQKHLESLKDISNEKDSSEETPVVEMSDGLLPLSMNHRLWDAHIWNSY